MARTAERYEPKYLTTRCRSCGQDIASNAIVCYKCGAPTDEPPPARQPDRRGGLLVWISVAVALALVAAVGWLVYR